MAMAMATATATAMGMTTATAAATTTARVAAAGAAGAAARVAAAATIAAIAAIAIALGTGTATVQAANAPGSTGALPATTAEQRRELLDEFVQLLKIPNIASDKANIRRNADAIVAMMQRRGLSPQLLTSSREPDAPPAVFGEWPVRNAKRTIILYAHYDGQPVNPSEWVTPPFTPTLRTAPFEKGGSVIPEGSLSAAAADPETRLYARGAGDDKAGIMVILGAIDALKAAHRTPTDSIKLVFEGEEEAGSPHLADLLTEHKALLDSRLWVVCDGPVHPTGRKMVVYGARGDMNIDLVVYGPVRALHSGHYGNWAQNPALNLARLLAFMKDDTGHVVIPGWYDDVAPLGDLEQRAIKDAATYDEAVRHELGIAQTESKGSLAAATSMPSLNINGMRSANIGAEAANVIPDSATAVLDVRLVLGNDPERQYGKLVEFIRTKGYNLVDHPPTLQERLEHPLMANVKLRPGVYAAARAPMDDPLAHAIAEAVRSSSDQPIIELPTSGGSLPLSIIRKALGTRSIDIPTANYDDNQHAANENLRLGNLWEGINTYEALLTHRPPQ
jgi:acetylornithine deacetylase/succinyl-diaminopimelate desuccinylase-like protein